MSSYYQPDWTNGTIDLTSGSTAFTIAGADLVAIGVQPGDSIYHTTTGRELIIDSVTDSTHGVLAYNCPADLAGASLPLRIRFQPDGSRFAAAYLNVLQKFKGGNLDALAGLTGAANKFPIFSGAGTMMTASQAPDSAKLGGELPTYYIAPHLFGLTLSNNTTETTSTFNVAPGQASDIDLGGILKLTTTFTKNFGVAWAEGSGFVGAAAYGALDTGTWATNTTYHVFLIGKSDGTVDVLCSTSPTNPMMPTGYTLKRRIGAILTDGSGSIRPFLQSGNEFLLSVPINDYAGNDPGTSAITPVLSVPTGIEVWALFGAYLKAEDDGRRSLLITSVDQDDSVPAAGTMVSLAAGANPAIVGTDNGYGTAAGEFQKRTNTSGQIRLRLDASGANTSVFVVTFGWIDPR